MNLTITTHLKGVFYAGLNISKTCFNFFIHDAGVILTYKKQGGNILIFNNIIYKGEVNVTMALSFCLLVYCKDTSPSA